VPSGETSGSSLDAQLTVHALPPVKGKVRLWVTRAAESPSA